MPKLSRPRKKGFTLVELLVVIAILSILAAMLLPALKKAVGSARAVACANNLKQWGGIQAFYANDNGDHLWPANFPAGWGGWSSNKWFHYYGCPPKKFYLPDVPNDLWNMGGHIRGCPSHDYNVMFDSNHHFKCLSYMVNYSIGQKRIPAIPRPSGTVWITESEDDFQASGFNSGVLDRVDYAHDGKTNILYPDGHVASSFLVEADDVNP